VFGGPQDSFLPAILHDTISNTIANLKFGSTLEVASKSHLGLTPLLSPTSPTANFTTWNKKPSFAIEPQAFPPRNSNHAKFP
jgi:hypothetical protein